jgi:phosphate transport system permease protein
MIKGLKKNPLDLIFASITAVSSFVVIFLIIGIIIVLLMESWPAIERFGVLGFLTSTDWNPVTESFGAATNIFGTFVTTLLSMIIAIPIAIGIAIFVTEISPNLLKGPIGGSIELLAAIPSIIYGMWGLFTLSPIMSNTVEPFLKNITADIPILSSMFSGPPMGIDLLTASIILSIMVIPFTASIARDSFKLTPSVVKESAYALGATKWEVIKHIIIPYAKLGVFGGIVLSLGRALGETMAVAFVLGNNHRIPGSLLDAAATITVTLANEFSEADKDIYLASLFYLALVLFALSFVTLAIAKFFLLKAERKYSR